MALFCCLTVMSSLTCVCMCAVISVALSALRYAVTPLLLLLPRYRLTDSDISTFPSLCLSSALNNPSRSSTGLGRHGGKSYLKQAEACTRLHCLKHTNCVVESTCSFTPVLYNISNVCSFYCTILLLTHFRLPIQHFRPVNSDL